MQPPVAEFASFESRHRRKGGVGGWVGIGKTGVGLCSRGAGLGHPPSWAGGGVARQGGGLQRAIRGGLKGSKGLELDSLGELYTVPILVT